MNIFSEVNALSLSTISTKLGLQESKDRKGYICPVCGHGKGGDGLRYNVKTKCPPRFWECYGRCGRSYSNVDLSAAVLEVSPNDKPELARRLKELYESEISDDVNQTSTSFLFQRTTEEPVRDFSKKYDFLRRHFPLEKFLNLRGGTWRGLTHETLKSAGALYNPSEKIAGGECEAILFPYDSTSYFWREVGGTHKGFSRGSKCNPYFLNPINMFNVVVEGLIDALSIKQAVGEYLGIIATGSVNNWRKLVNFVADQKSQLMPRDKVRFLVLFDNDEAGKQHGELLTMNLRSLGFPSAQGYLVDLVEGKFGDRVIKCGLMKGKWKISSRDGVQIFEQPKLDANDVLQSRDEKFLCNLIFNLIDWHDSQFKMKGR